MRHKKGKFKMMTKVTQRKGHFIMNLGKDSIQLVNADSYEIQMFSFIIRTYCTIVKEYWTNSMIYNIKISHTSRQSKIHLLGDLLVSLLHSGWQALSPFEIETKKKGRQTAICFKKNYYVDEKMKMSDLNWLCLEACHGSFIMMHNVSNIVLADLVGTADEYWGVQGVSMTVSSVIRDYSSVKYEVLNSAPVDILDNFIKLEGHPWQGDTDELEEFMIATLAQSDYKLHMAVNMDTGSKIFYFIRGERKSNEVYQYNKAGAGIGSKQSLAVYRPLVKRSKSSFFRSFENKESLRKKVKGNQKKKNKKENSTKNRCKDAWFKETSVDVATDYEDEDEDYG